MTRSFTRTRTDFMLPPDLVVGAEADCLPLAGEANWGMAWEGLGLLRDAAAGQVAKVGIVDTGVDADHPLLKGRVKDARDFTGSSVGPNSVLDAPSMPARLRAASTQASCIPKQMPKNGTLCSRA